MSHVPYACAMSYMYEFYHLSIIDVTYKAVIQHANKPHHTRICHIIYTTCFLEEPLPAAHQLGVSPPPPPLHLYR